MRLLDRYLLRELLIPLSFCLSGFLIFWTAFDLFVEIGDLLQDKKLRPAEIVEYYLLITPEFLVLVLPIALLLALLYALTNHARHHEITAIRAAGVGVWRLSLPYLAVGFIISLVSFAVNEFWVPDSADAAEQVLTKHLPIRAGAVRQGQVRNLGFTNAREQRIWQIGMYQYETAEMIGPQVFWKQPDGSRLWIKAERGVYTNDVWTFFEVTQYEEGAGTNSDLVPILQTNELTMPLFSETPEEIKSELRISQSMALRRSGRQKADISVSEIASYLRLHPKLARSDRNWLFTRLHGRLATPWTCFIVVLIAIPFGAASGRRNVFVGVASSILICFVYFILQQVALALGTGGYLPPWLAAWLPNMAFGLVGLWMTATVR